MGSRRLRTPKRWGSSGAWDSMSSEFKGVGGGERIVSYLFSRVGRMIRLMMTLLVCTEWLTAISLTRPIYDLLGSLFMSMLS